MKMAGDASAYGIGALISHVYPDGSEWLIAYASRTLTTAEKNYPQIEREALSLVYRIWKFHQYLYECQFVLVTDHKPLATLLGPTKRVPPLAAAVHYTTPPYCGKIWRVRLYTELFYAIMPTLYLCFLLICYPYILLHF